MTIFYCFFAVFDTLRPGQFNPILGGGRVNLPLPSPPHPPKALGIIVYMGTTSKQLVVCSGWVNSSHLAICAFEVEKTKKTPPQDRVNILWPWSNIPSNRPSIFHVMICIGDLTKNLDTMEWKLQMVTLALIPCSWLMTILFSIMSLKNSAKTSNQRVLRPYEGTGVSWKGIRFSTDQ